jgi:hypothetical protein
MYSIIATKMDYDIISYIRALCPHHMNHKLYESWMFVFMFTVVSLVFRRVSETEMLDK